MPKEKKIQIFRKTGLPSAGDFVEGEPTWNRTNKTLYVKDNAGNFIPIGGESAPLSGATATIGDVAGGDYFEIEEDGTVKLNGAATAWDDLQVSISNVKLPASSAPDYELYDFGITGGVEFPVLAFAVGEYIFFDVQSSHSMKLSSILDNHIHYNTPNTTDIGDNFKFQLDVIGAAINAQWAVPTGSPFTKEIAVAANDDTYHRIDDIADIPGINTTVSTLYKCKLTRIAASTDEYGSDVYITFTACNYEKDGMGSRDESSK
jgi:hypothetical protein